MKTAICLLAIAFAVLPFASAQQKTQTYAQIAPSKYAIDLTYLINGTEVASPPCTNSAPGTECLPKLNPGDKVMITYAVNTTTPANATSTITLRACFGAQSSANRAWRKAGPVIVDDKSCSTKITTGLPPTGNFTYTVTTRLAPAVYRIQALEICPENVACSMGSSVGYFQTYTINATPGWLMAMAGCFAAIGPCALVAFFVWEQYVKKRQ